MVVADLLLGSFKFEAPFLDKIEHHAQFLDVGCGVKPCALFIAFGVDDCELALPIAEGGGGQAEQFGHLTDFVIFFLKVIQDAFSVWLHDNAHCTGVIFPCKSSEKIVILRLKNRHVS